ncbi:MAG: hypothetical protein HYR91_08185 [Flavobacteriia bacterium]|nr:hypothetical protein [Flavobacteriia bacterium]
MEAKDFSVIYSFKIKQEFRKEFIQSWNEITALIYQNEGSLGSRLQMIDETTFLGYALWPSKAIFIKASKIENKEIAKLKAKQSEYVEEINKRFESSIISDLIKNKTYTYGDKL